MEPPLNRATTTLIGLFRPGASLTAAVERCRALGVPAAAVDVLSTIPLSQPLGHQPESVPLHRWALAGGILGLLLGVSVAAGTALLYPLQTGGMGIVAPPVVAIIAYEGMMFGAIVMTFWAIVRRIRGRASVPADARIDEGWIGVAIVLGDGLPPVAVLRGALEAAGACEVVEL